MGWLTGLVGRYAPLITLGMLGVGLFGVFAQLGVTARGVDAALARWVWAFVVVALVSWAVVGAGILFELRPGPGTLRKGLIVDALSRLTNQAALEALMGGKDESVFIDAADLSARLKARVIGQDTVCDDLAAQIRRRLALAQRGKPVGIFLLAGPPGTGKTYLSGRLAAEMDRRLLAFDMTQFSSPHAATQLFGSPKGYVGSDSYGKLTSSLRDTPDAVVLLDEFEKADPEVHKKFLTAWNDGYVTEASDGKQISTKRSIFMMTTNAATDELTDLARRFRDDPDELRRTSIDALKSAGFAPEVLNRLDRVFVFRQLEGLDIARVAALEIEAMIQNYGLGIADGGIDPHVLFGLMRRQERLGSAASSRDLVRAIEEAVGDSLINAKQARARLVRLVVRDGAIVAEIAD